MLEMNQLLGWSMEKLGEGEETIRNLQIQDLVGGMTGYLEEKEKLVGRGENSSRGYSEEEEKEVEELLSHRMEEIDHVESKLNDQKEMEMGHAQGRLDQLIEKIHQKKILLINTLEKRRGDWEAKVSFKVGEFEKRGRLRIDELENKGKSNEEEELLVEEEEEVEKDEHQSEEKEKEEEEENGGEEVVEDNQEVSNEEKAKDLEN